MACNRSRRRRRIGRATLYKYFSGVDPILIAWHERHALSTLSISRTPQINPVNLLVGSNLFSTPRADLRSSGTGTSRRQILSRRGGSAAREQVAVHLWQGHAIDGQDKIARPGPRVIACHSYTIPRRSLLPNMPPPESRAHRGRGRARASAPTPRTTGLPRSLRHWPAPDGPKCGRPSIRPWPHRLLVKIRLVSPVMWRAPMEQARN